MSDSDIPLIDWDLVRSDSSVTLGSSSATEYSLSDSDDSKVLKQFNLRTRYCFVTWTQSQIRDPNEFYEKLVEKMPPGTEIFGCQEPHVDGGIHYHAIVKLATRPHWKNAVPRFMLKTAAGEIDTRAIRIVVCRGRLTLKRWLEIKHNYCRKMENPVLFGTPIAISSESDKSERKRVFEEIVNEPDPVVAEEMIKKWDAWEYATRYIPFRALLKDKAKVVAKKRKVERREEYDPKSWNVPDSILAWKSANIDNKPKGRPTTLVIVGESRTGKTSYAESIGKNPIVMTECWNLDLYDPDASHVVVNDVHPLKFGNGSHVYWRAVMGCQKTFSAYGRYRATTDLAWCFPCVWTCNPDLDPRNFPDVKAYLESSGAIIVDIGATPLFVKS